MRTNRFSTDLSYDFPVFYLPDLFIQFSRRFVVQPNHHHPCHPADRFHLPEREQCFFRKYQAIRKYRETSMEGQQPAKKNHGICHVFGIQPSSTFAVDAGEGIRIRPQDYSGPIGERVHILNSRQLRKRYSEMFGGAGSEKSGAGRSG